MCIAITFLESEPMKLRRLTDTGIEAFSNYLAMLRAEPTLAPPVQLLDSPGVSEPLKTDAAVEPRPFATRLDAAEYLHGLLAGSGLIGLDRDRGLWTWLTLYYFDQLCPADGHGKRKAGEDARYIPNMSDTRRYYRHLQYGPFAMYRMHHNKPELLPVFLMNPLTVGTSETFRSFIENNEFLSANSAVSVANKLYYDTMKKKLRRGAGSKTAGGCRRLIDFLHQITLTYDLQRLNDEQLFAMLPAEFNTFKKAYIADGGLLAGQK
jgi:hypothetical protein